MLTTSDFQYDKLSEAIMNNKSAVDQFIEIYSRIPTDAIPEYAVLELARAIQADLEAIKKGDSDGKS